ncbi:hypothetical protein GK047_13735 [Paenibacillus sp. SYP-B3998]|uniref:SWIM-type domain-containing protein n=1 Tax=Paenibacillus sp. SYP-B3998 TaxID=2678564 RepID=A0A6G3ZYE2_9BACL|nr:SWIM zinc finger family protein [Paenibacillus sp. SYP-B3998]NEW07068.1 hypothetical protein [Paenibacillus sp. SYP-B3998]
MLDVDIDWNQWSNQLRPHFSEAIVQRGWLYYQQHAVMELSMEGTSVIKARVSGASAYRVRIALDDFSRSSCSCPYAYGSSCKHMAAVLFEVSDQLGFEPKELFAASGKTGGNRRPEGQSFLKEIPRPSAKDTSSVWHAYFEKQFGSAKVYNASSVEELYTHALDKLRKVADGWQPMLKAIYEIHVVLFLMELCDSLVEDLSGNNYYYQNISYYYSEIAKSTMEQLAHAMRYVDPKEAWLEHPQYVTELAAHLGGSVLEDKQDSKMNWTGAYRLLWWNLLHEKSLISTEVRRLRELASDKGRSIHARKAAVMALVHFDIMAGHDETAMERITAEVRRIDPGDWFGYLQTFAQLEQWHRLVNWLKWLQPAVGKTANECTNTYFHLWNEAAKHVDIVEEQKQAMVALLPGSYRHYSRSLLDKKEYQTWADLILLLDLTPFHIESSDWKLVEKENIRVLLPIYHHAAEQFIMEKNRDSYKRAVRLLKRLGTVYKKLKQSPRFESYIQQLSKQYTRYRAFQEELRKGKLIT